VLETALQRQNFILFYCVWWVLGGVRDGLRRQLAITSVLPQMQQSRIL
jgi:hypothetical protein